MTQEELQNWIICGALYWKTTGDKAWLVRNKDTFTRALRSMQLRDDIDPAKRDGITTYVSNVGQRSGEITTYDAMDASLQHPQDSLYIAGKSFACYTMLAPVFAELGEPDLERQARAAEAYTAKGILPTGMKPGSSSPPCSTAPALHRSSPPSKACLTPMRWD